MGEAYGRKVCDRGLNHHPCTVVDIIVGAPDSEAFTVLDEQATVGGVWDIEASLTGEAVNSHPAFILLLPTPTLVGYAGGSTCTLSSTAAPCPSATSGSLLVSRSGCESWKRKSFWTRGLERRVPFVFVLPHIEHFYH